MTCPLYKITPPWPTNFPRDGHAGLWYDRFFNKYDNNWQVPKDSSGKLAWINTVKGIVGGPAVALFTERQKNLVDALDGKTSLFKTDWHFATGLGNNHPVENGFAWHTTLGVPYLTGAAVKGLLRAWCEQWATGFDADKCRLWFGPSLGELDPEKNSGIKKQGPVAGELIFFDALPTGQVELKPDVMTPHMGDWYEKGDKPLEKDKKEGSNVPADWHSPVPVFFLVVAPGQMFQFSVAKRPKSDIDVDDVMKELEQALTYLGAGAKTAVGYGRFQKVDCSDVKAINTPTAIIRSRFNIGDKVNVKRTEDPKGRGRIWFEAEDGFGGVVTRGSVPQVEIGKELELWIASVSNNYNFSAEPIPQVTRRPPPQWKNRV
jgi:CRISPR-associated protein Cmr6